MSRTQSLDQVLRLAQELSAADQLRLIARLAPQLTAALDQPASQAAQSEQLGPDLADYRAAIEHAARLIAARTGLPVKAVLADWRAQHQGKQDEANPHDAWVRLEPHLGAVDAGLATGADNESIDADLARAYAETNEQAS
jgi:hypothetical protein